MLKNILKEKNITFTIQSPDDELEESIKYIFLDKINNKVNIFIKNQPLNKKNPIISMEEIATNNLVIKKNQIEMLLKRRTLILKKRLQFADALVVCQENTKKETEETLDIEMKSDCSENFSDIINNFIAENDKKAEKDLTKDAEENLSKSENKSAVDEDNSIIIMNDDKSEDDQTGMVEENSSNSETISAGTVDNSEIVEDFDTKADKKATDDEAKEDRETSIDIEHLTCTDPTSKPAECR